MNFIIYCLLYARCKVRIFVEGYILLMRNLLTISACVLSCFSHFRHFATPWSLPGSSVHGILQARALERVAMPSSRGSFWTQGSNPGLLTSPALAGGYLTTGATWASSLILPLAPLTIREICKLINSHGGVNSRTQEAHSWRCGASEAIDSVPWVSEIRRGCAQVGALSWDRKDRD